VKTCAHFQQAADFAVESDAALGWRSDAAEKLEESGFASTISADQAVYFTLLNFKGYVTQTPKVFKFLVLFSFSGKPAFDAFSQVIPQGRVAIGRILSLTGFDAVAFCQILDFDHGLKEEGPELFADLAGEDKELE
jgi:hypothetical protein